MNNPCAADAREKEDNPHLEPLLAKLRPFQREAYEFATKGTSFNRQWAEEQLEEDAFEYDEQYLGKGRILLADEMGLGKVSLPVICFATCRHFNMYSHPISAILDCDISRNHDTLHTRMATAHTLPRFPSSHMAVRD
jgi:hypothetical protein